MLVLLLRLHVQKLVLLLRHEVVAEVEALVLVEQERSCCSTKLAAAE